MVASHSTVNDIVIRKAYEVE